MRQSQFHRKMIQINGCFKLQWCSLYNGMDACQEIFEGQNYILHYTRYVLCVMIFHLL